MAAVTALVIILVRQALDAWRVRNRPMDGGGVLKAYWGWAVNHDGAHSQGAIRRTNR